MQGLSVSQNWIDPEANIMEIVERKGLGHPDTLADGLAEAISTAYSLYCLDRFSVVPHHNLDKLYIGAGLFKRDFGYREMVKPVRIRINGRISNTMNGEKIPINEITRRAVHNYLDEVLPNLHQNEMLIECNSTQHTKNPYWFSPRDINDLPEAGSLNANDTSVCIAHWPFTVCERLAFELEQSFWTKQDDYLVPKYGDVGQDIKVMAQRLGKEIDVTMCIPMISETTLSSDQYLTRIQEIEDGMNKLANIIVSGSDFTVKTKVNSKVGGGRLIYLLATGSCVDCGEEGLVGRGNTNQGVISCFRPHSMEAPAGKNPVYHTGRVMGFLTARLAKSIYDNLHTQCTVIIVTKNGHSLIPPSTVSIQTKKVIAEDQVIALINECFDREKYLRWILSERMVR